MTKNYKNNYNTRDAKGKFTKQSPLINFAQEVSYAPKSLFDKISFLLKKVMKS